MISRKTLLQKLSQLIDREPKNLEVKKDFLKLKLSEDDKFYLTLENKYKNKF